MIAQPLWLCCEGASGSPPRSTAGGGKAKTLPLSAGAEGLAALFAHCVFLVDVECRLMQHQCIEVTQALLGWQAWMKEPEN